MAKKQWETVMLSKETKEKLKALKGKESYEVFINKLLANQPQSSNNSPSLSTNIDMELLIRDYLDPMKAYMQNNTPDAKIMAQVKQFAEEFNAMEADLERAIKRINVLTQDNERLKKKKNR